MAATGRVLVTPPVEPVTLSEAKQHLRVDVPDDDALIQRCVASARRWAESYSRRAFASQTWDVYYSAWSAAFEIPLPPLQNVVSVSYRTSAGETLVVSPAVYLADTVAEPGRVLLAPGQSWPSVPLWPVNPVVIRAAVGYITVPDDIKAAILLLAGYLYENREQAAHPLPKTLPFAAENLLMPYIAGWF